MAQQKKVLGRGLSALIPGKETAREHTAGIAEIEIDRIDRDSVMLTLGVASEDPDAKSQLHLLALKAFEVSQVGDAEPPG